MHTSSLSCAGRVVLFGLAATASLFVGSLEAQAKGEIIELHMVSQGSQRFVVAVSDVGVVFLKPSGSTVETLRAWKSAYKAPRKGPAPDGFKIVDADADGSDDVVVLGKPAFAISAVGKPLGAPPKGCTQTFIADFTSDRGLEVACRKGSTVDVTTLDGQFLRKHSIQGLRFESCAAGDVNGDLRADLECKIAGKSKWARIDLDNEAEIGLDFDSAQVDVDEHDAPDSSGLLQGSEMFDLNGDGTTEESLLADGDNIVVRSKSKKAAFGRYPLKKPSSALVTDINKDGKKEIFVGGAGKVLVINHEGKLIATLNADPSKMKREASVEFTGMSANGLEDMSRDALKKGLDPHAKKLAACYSSTVRSNPFAQIGRSIWTLHINDKGGVKRVEKYHSSLRDKRTLSCLSGALKKASFSKGTKSGASVTVTISSGYVDR